MFSESLQRRLIELNRFRTEAECNAYDAKRKGLPSDLIWHYWDYNLLFPKLDNQDIGGYIKKQSNQRPTSVLDVFSQGFFFTRLDIPPQLGTNLRLVTIDVNCQNTDDSNIPVVHLIGDFFDSRTYKRNLESVNPKLEFDVVVANPGGVMFADERPASIALTNMVLSKLWKLTKQDGVLYCAFETCLFPYPNVFDFWTNKLSSKHLRFDWRVDTSSDHLYSFWIQKNSSKPIPMI